MEKIFVNETIGILQSFVGFYDSIWSPNDTIYYECEEEGLKEDVDFTFDYKQYQNDICQAYTEVWELWMQEFISNDIELEFVEVHSPRYYNYENDSCRVKIRLTQAAEDAIIAKIKKHRNQLAKWIKKTIQTMMASFPIYPTTSTSGHAACSMTTRLSNLPISFVCSIILLRQNI